MTALAIGFALWVAALVVIVRWYYYCEQQGRIEKNVLEEKLIGIRLLNDAMAHLDFHGLGENLGDARARVILEYALESVLYGR